MRRIRTSRWGRVIARWPSAAVVGASVLSIIVASRFLPASAAWPVGLAAVVPVVAYCVLRTTRRGDVINAWLAPSALSTILHDITGVSQWIVALPVLMIGLAVLADDDRRERRTPAQPA